MKKITSAILTLAVALGLLSSFGAVNVFAQENAGGLTTEQWKPIEITLTSEKSYSNPYKDTEINAVFTHEDGTTISTPGFVKDGKLEWAVRFTPTKIGKWTYNVTCTDAENKSLFADGTVNATASTGTTELAKHGFVKISDTSRYFTYDDGTPFLWMGDTNWQSPNFIHTAECNYPGCTCGSQLKHEVDNRKAKGFNVYQTYFSGSVTTGIWKTAFSKPDYESYNSRIDFMFDYIYNSDMVIALGFGLHSGTPTSINEEDFVRFTRYVVARYSCYSIVWITGQEITNVEKSATPGKNCMEVFMAAAEMVDATDGYRHPNGAHMYPMKSDDARAKLLDEQSWHKTWILQGGHGAKVKTGDFYQSYYRNASGTVKPFIEGECNYEDINCGGFTGYDAPRMCAWKAMISGCAGFTYGGSGIWIDAYTRTDARCLGEDSSYSYDLWYMGLDKPGSFEITYLKNFLTTLPDWTKLVPRYNIAMYADFFNVEEKDVATTDDMRTVFAYFYNKDKTSGTVKTLDSSLSYNAYWYNPLTGKYIIIDTNITCADGTYTLPEKPTAGDWAFLMTADKLNNDVYLEETFKDPGTSEVEGTAVYPKKISALGGVYTEGKKIIDNTINLFDGKTTTTWKPFANRSSQTFFLDLGEAQDLTHLVITPAAGTIIPNIRVDASNDNEHWTILVNNSLRENDIDANGNVSEKLSGGFRYVKIILLNAKTLDPKETADLNYRVFFNGQTKNSYSETEIADIAIYSNGVSANPFEEKVLTVDGKISGASDVTVAGNSSNIQVPAIIVLAAGVVCACVAGVVVLKKKKENK